jgi:hypothetical protein
VRNKMIVQRCQRKQLRHGFVHGVPLVEL